MALEVHVPTLASASFDLATATERLAATRRFMRSMALPADADLAAGLDAVKVAWGAALGVLEEDTQFMATQVADAAELYDTTDQALASVVGSQFEQPS